MNKKRILVAPIFVAMFLNLLFSFGVSAAQHTVTLPLIPLKPGDQYQDPTVNGVPLGASDPAVHLLEPLSATESGYIHGPESGRYESLNSWRVDTSGICKEASISKLRISLSSYFERSNEPASVEPSTVLFMSQNGEVNTNNPLIYNGATHEDAPFAVVRGNFGKAGYLNTEGPMDGEWQTTGATLAVHLSYRTGEIEPDASVNATNLSAQVTYDDSACYPANVTAPKSGDKYNFAVILVSGFIGAGMATTLIFCLGGRKKQTSK